MYKFCTFNNKKKIQDISNKIIGNEKEVQVNDSFYDKFNIINEAFRCISCYSNYMNYSMSCGHLGICTNCYNYIKESNNQYKNKCMICRKKLIKYNKFIIPFSETELNYAVDYDSENMLLFKKKFSQLEKLDKIINQKENEKYRLNDTIELKKNEIKKYENHLLNMKDNIISAQIEYDYYENNIVTISKKYRHMKYKKLWIFFLDSLILKYNIYYYEEELNFLIHNPNNSKFLNL